MATDQVTVAQRRLRHELASHNFGPDASLNVLITGRIADKPWTDSLDFDEITFLVLHLSTASLITTAYLSGMRPEEVLHLARGCCTREEREDGTSRYKITGRHFKGASPTTRATPFPRVRSAPIPGWSSSSWPVHRRGRGTGER